MQPPSLPPQSPSVGLETTTIGKYIARFRYEKPQPREARMAAEHGDFWWTRSPRYTRSLSPFSKRESNDVFDYLDDDEEDNADGDSEIKVKEEIMQLPAEEECESVENKLHRRSTCLSRQSIEKTRDSWDRLGTVRTSESMQSWDSVNLELMDFEDEEIRNEEDPEDVIERVRRRLGWDTTMPANGLLNAPRPKPTKFQLAIAKRGCHNLGMKPPLSPNLCTRLDAVDKSTPSLRPSQLGREFGARDFNERVSPTCDASARIVSVIEVEENLEHLAIAEQDVQLEAGNKFSKSVTYETVSDVLSSGDFTIKQLQCSCKTVASQLPESEKAFDSAVIIPSNNIIEKHRSIALSQVEKSGPVEENRFVNLQSPHQIPDDDTAGTVTSSLLEQKASPVRASSASKLAVHLSSDQLIVVQDQDLTSSGSSDKMVSVETTKILHDMVNFVVRSWENNFHLKSVSELKDSRGESQEQIASLETNVNLQDNACDETVSHRVGLTATSKGSDTDKEVGDDAQNLKKMTTEDSVSHHVGLTATSKGSDTDNEVGDDAQDLTKMTTEDSNDEIFTQYDTEFSNKESTRPEREDEKIEDGETSEEENDPIVQMLQNRIFLLEEALRQIDN
ncbi:uncharacterized protein PHALS_02818 [Plasmopara halstedii]|uniref:Uncharacterized protein n=1 Tax=Plasmopara halstedii TaxID=4781 RepID=A0A0P1AVP9_PLAHL|nr:uncharacterized protein PHALS_02818 [Plasmopara halstedii]CEG46415.1 hypothetical protein PHALS_02818 [Plasmopara halstedii]|eukprot:XP_024582784.1 hypothetical protein PHALS_02818 [Plasmopara halstedii]